MGALALTRVSSFSGSAKFVGQRDTHLGNDNCGADPLCAFPSSSVGFRNSVDDAGDVVELFLASLPRRVSLSRAGQQRIDLAPEARVRRARNSLLPIMNSRRRHHRDLVTGPCRLAPHPPHTTLVDHRHRPAVYASLFRLLVQKVANGCTVRLYTFCSKK